LGSQGPVEGLQPEAVPLQGIAELLSQLQRLGGLIRVGEAGADAVLLRFGTGRVRGSRRHGRPQAHPTTRHIEGDPMTFQLQSGVLAAEPGVGGRHRICLTICLIVVDPGRFA
jgi:hypothetical protein